MRIEPCEKYISGLAGLWHKVFADSYDYINLLFENEFYFCDTFVKEKNGIIVSALYLLNCIIRFDGKEYKGRYLYAAATDPEYRGKGYMAELIREAQLYCEKQEIDFISLVPANEHLYSYYSKFGFATAMHRYETKTDSIRNCENIKICCTLDNIDRLHSIRKACTGNCFYFVKEDLQYAMKCIAAGGGKVFSVSDKSYFITDEDFSTVEEFVSSEKDFRRDVEKLISCLDKELVLYSPYDLSEYGKTQIQKYGMIYPINNKLKRDWSLTDIYMNLALD